ncbi:MAG: efflux RND transporter permease subunit, partial [Amylibacter sp.]
MKITRIIATPVNIPLEKPMWWAGGHYPGASKVIIEVETNQGTFSVTIPSSFHDVSDIYTLPVKINGDRVVTLGELAEINFTFEDRKGTARFDGENTVALQVVKRKGYNLIDTVDQVKATLAAAQAKWPKELQAAVTVGTSN